MTRPAKARVWLLVIAATALAVSGLAEAAPAAPVARLRVGQTAFWGGGVRPAAQQPDFVWQIVYRYHVYSRDYPIVVAERGHLLRVALDHWTDGYHWIEMLDPSGNRVTYSDGWVTQEAYVDSPRLGTWIARVRSTTQDPNFRMRAKLEGLPAPRPDPPRRLLPNLRLIPPFEFTFHTPPTPLSWYGLPSPDSPMATCTADDTAQYQAHRCLRFSLGPANTGPGPFQMRFEQLQGVAAPGKAYQRIYDTDGTFVERPAGEFQYHMTHMHYHHTGMGSLELWRVTDSKRGRMVVAGHGPKQGFCTADIVMFDFRVFTQARYGSTESACVTDMTPIGTYGPIGTTMGISPGWADLYAWGQDGNYVEFGDNPDGRYVVRSTTDVDNHVLEANENDNTSYAYIEVRGTGVKVLERGFGWGPWDPRKVLAHDLLPGTPAAYA